MFASSDESLQVMLPSKTMGVVVGLDKDGDAQICFPALGSLKCCIRWALHNNFGKMSMARPSHKAKTKTPGLHLQHVPEFKEDQDGTMPTV